MDCSETSGTGLSQAAQKLHGLGTVGYSVILHIRGLSARFTERTYPAEWIDFYDRHGFAVRDPVLGWCVEHTGSLRWSEPDLADPYGVMTEASRFGLRYGMSMSVGPRNCRSVISVARHDRELTEGEREDLLDIGAYLHQLVPLEVILSEKQMQALRCLADGLRSKQATEVLGISESAYKLRISAVRNRLGARTTAEAVQRAKEYNLI